MDTEKLTKPVARFAARKKASEFCEIAQYSPGLKTLKSVRGSRKKGFLTCDTSLDLVA